MRTKEITYRNWFIIKFGEINLDAETRTNYVKPKPHAEIEKLYRADLSVVGYSIPTFNSLMKYTNTIESDVRNNGTFEVPAMQESVSFEHIEGATTGVLDADGNNPHIKAPEPYKFNAFILDEMEENEVRLMKTGTVFDKICSDFEEGGGIYGGTVNIVTGESGVGKTTLLAEMLAMLMEQGEKEGKPVKPVYISSEMTRSDLPFYRAKTPRIGKVPTVIGMDYIRKGQFIEMLEDVFTMGLDIIILDSLADTIGKVMDVGGYTEKGAMRFLIDLMIKSAEDYGTAVFAVQHLTKSGTYVGSTYLKHTTTAMMEMWFDKSGKRYVYFSKNRRGGSMQKKPVFFELKDGKVVFDEKKFNEILEAEELAKKDAERREQSARDFLDILEHRENAGEGKESDDSKELNVDGMGGKIEEPITNLDELNQEVKEELDNETNEEKPNGPLSFGDAIEEIAEDTAFEDVPSND